MSATAFPPSSPGYQAWITAAHFSARPEMTWARPPNITNTTGLPVLMSSWTYSSCFPGKRSPWRSRFSPQSITFSPMAATITSQSWAIRNASALSVRSPASTLRCRSSYSQARASPSSLNLVSISSVQSQPREYKTFIPSGLRDAIPSSSLTIWGFSDV